MVKALTASELKPGSTFRDGIVSRTTIEKKRGNGPDIKITLAADYQRYQAKKWHSDDAELALIRGAQFLVISGEVTRGGQYDGEITINSVRAAADEELPEDMSPYLSPYHEKHDQHIMRFECLVESVLDPYLNRLLTMFFDRSQRYWPEYCAACAAGNKHHAYRGGLLHHSVEVAELCAYSCRTLPGLNRDLLVTCALLHDVGKLKEIEHGLNAGEYTPSGILNGHITQGAMMLRPFMASRRIPSFPEELKEAVTHMIVSHHGSREFGSPQPPAFTEAYVLSECDMMSARAFQYASAIGAGKEWLPGDDRIRLYTGSLGLNAVPQKTFQPEPAEVFTTQRRTPPERTFTTSLRIKGLAAAGSPEQGSDEEDGTREVALPPKGADYLVRVTGDSMADAGLQERDLLFVKATETPKSGDIVVAHVAASGEVVKRYRCVPAAAGATGYIRLESENCRENYPPIAVDADTRIRGVVTGLLRDF